MRTKTRALRRAPSSFSETVSEGSSTYTRLAAVRIWVLAAEEEEDEERE